MTGSVRDAGPAGSSEESSPVPGSGRDKTFEELMAELESLTGRLAAGDVGIEAAADLYERAEAIHAQAKQRLDQVRTRVERIAGATPPPEASADSAAVSYETGETGCDGAS